MKVIFIRSLKSIKNYGDACEENKCGVEIYVEPKGFISHFTFADQFIEKKERKKFAEDANHFCDGTTEDSSDESGRGLNVDNSESSHLLTLLREKPPHF